METSKFQLCLLSAVFLKTVTSLGYQQVAQCKDLVWRSGTGHSEPLSQFQ